MFDYQREYERLVRLYGCSVSDPALLVATIQRLIDSSALDSLSETDVNNVAERVYMMSMRDHSYERYAVCTLLDDLYRRVPDDLRYPVAQMQNVQHKSDRNVICPLLTSRYIANVYALAPYLAPYIDWQRDTELSYFGLVTLLQKYLLHLTEPRTRVVERPQHMYMRVALTIFQNQIVMDPDHPQFQRVVQDIVETYHMLSRGLYTHATPVLTNSGTIMQQLASCFLLEMRDDSLDGIYDTLKQCALISKWSGGVGLNIMKIRGKGSLIHGTNGLSNGVPSMLKVFDTSSVYVDQGGNKRPGAFAVYMEPWHADVLEFVKLRRQTGNHTDRVQHLFLGLWVPDLFMRRVEQDLEWTLFSPDDTPVLLELHGDAFEREYQALEQTFAGRKKVVRARELMREIVMSQIETGMPYMLYKDSCNRRSNQQHLGTIKCSNLCTEIVQYTSREEVAVCNLASLALPRFVMFCRPGDVLSQVENYARLVLPKEAEFRSEPDDEFFCPVVHLGLLKEVVRQMVRNMDSLIDVTEYPLPETRRSNMRHRPLGLGVQGLADVFCLFGCAWGDPLSRKLNVLMFEGIYYAAVKASVELADERGFYPTYPGSPASRGLLQMDMWDAVETSGLFDWPKVRQKMQRCGLRNSLLTTVMPTASTSQLLGNSISIEPYRDNIYKRITNCGEFLVVNRHLERDLKRLGLFTDAIVEQIIEGRGSVQHIESLPARLRQVYRTVYETSQRTLLEMNRDRAPYIDQSQSHNNYLLDDGDLFNRIYNCHMYGWRLGLKTGSYYVHVINKQLHSLGTKQSTNAKQLDTEKPLMCNRDDAGCVSCHS